MGFQRAKRDDWAEAEASSKAFFQLRDYVGEVLAFEVLMYDDEHVNDFKDEVKAVKTNVTICSGQDKGVVFEREWIQASVVTKTLKDKIGDTYVARLTRGGKAFLFEEITDDEWEAARKVLAGETSGPRYSNDTPKSSPADEVPF